MSDFFGIGTAMKGMALTYFQAARATGRTTSMLVTVEDGDRIIFTDEREATRVRHLLHEMGKKRVECIVVSVNLVDKIFHRKPSEGRTIFDHTWIEEYYFNALYRANKEIRHFQQQSSGYSEAHRRTQRAAMEIRKWQH
jgi:hypothetical protein